MADQEDAIEHGGECRDRSGTVSPVREPFAERVLHVDMDAFFVEVERRRDPSLRGVPVVVGGTGPRGVVASASYEARRRGVRSAMPTAQARRMAPSARFVPPSHGVYGEASAEVFAVVEGFTPVYERLSVDEAFLDISGLRLLHDSAAAVGAALRSAIRERTGLPASVGVATSKLIAKLASEDAKPDGMLVVPAGTETSYLHPKPVGALWHVGEATRARLEELGIATIGDLAATPPETLVRRLGPTLGRALSDLAAARDDRPIEPGEGAKSISVEETYHRDLTDPQAIDRELVRHSDRLAGRLRRSGWTGSTVTLKVRFGDFSTITRSETIGAPTATAHVLLSVARRLLERAAARARPVRLLGLGVSSLEPATAPRQLAIGDAEWDDVEDAVAQIRARFGPDAVGPARLLDDPGSQKL